MKNKINDTVIHIMSSGKALLKTYKVAVKKYQMDRVIIFDNVLTSKNEGERNSVVAAIKEVEDFCKEFLKVNVVIIQGDVNIDSVMEKFIDVYKENKGAKYMFNITPGMKPLALCLFYVSIWVNGTSYYVNEGVGEENEIIEFKRPKVDMNALHNEKNPNYKIILEFLYSSSEKTRTMNEIKEKMGVGCEGAYIAVRSTKKEQRQVTAKMVTDWITKLEEWGLVRRENIDGRSKKVVLTTEGRFTTNFLKGDS